MSLSWDNNKEESLDLPGDFKGAQSFSLNCMGTDEALKMNEALKFL